MDHANLLRQGHYVDLLVDDTARPIVEDFVCCLLSPSRPGRATISAARVEEKLAVGQAALNAFLQANVTGPVLKGAARVEDVLAAAAAGAAGGMSPRSSAASALRKTCLASLDVDGVSVYPHVPHIELFCLARHVLDGLPHDAPAGGGLDGAGVSPRWLRFRVHVWHYKLLTQPSLGPGSLFARTAQWCDVPSLRGVMEADVAAVESDVLPQRVGSGPSLASADVGRVTRVRFLVEAAGVWALLGREGLARQALGRAAREAGFVYALSGALGKRTRFQEKSTSQLVVLARSSICHGQEEDKGRREEQARPEAMKLNDDTLLEKIDFSQAAGDDAVARTEDEVGGSLPAALRDISPDDQPALAPLDQIMLLTEATLRDAFSPADTLTAEEVLPFATRVIAEKATNWQIYTQALLVRSRIEVHRSRTVERGVLQMQAVVDQVVVDTRAEAGDAVPTIQVSAPGAEAANGETLSSRPGPTSFFPAAKATETAPAHVRLEYVHALNTPPRWHLESELAYAWAGVGSLVSALEIFKRLRLWAEVALCLASSAASDDPDGRGGGGGGGGEAKARTVLRWQLFRRTPSPVSKADTDAVAAARNEPEANDMMDLDPTAGLGPSDFAGPERSPPPPNAPRLLCILGDLEDDASHYERAWALSGRRFARAQRALGEWHLRRKQWERARDAYAEAVRVNRLSAEMWSRLGDIQLRLGAFEAAAEAYGRAIAAANDVVGGEDARTWSNLGSALYSLYLARLEEVKKGEGEGKGGARGDDDEKDKRPDAAAEKGEPATYLAQSLSAYKRGAALARDNWRIWDNVITLAARLRPPAVADMLLAVRQVLTIRASEDALDADVLRLLLTEGLFARAKPGSEREDEGKGACGGGGVYEPPRGTTERAVVQLLEEVVVPLITTRSELWELVVREREWRRDFAGALEAAERAWRAAVGEGEGVAGWLEEDKAWGVVVERTEALVALLEKYGPGVDAVGTRWRSKARSAVRSVMGKGREVWEGSEAWGRLEGLLEALAQ
ncbi:hypothetical protein P8C59_004480 [Phyllachora maydis]|uniref:TPR repeat-containing protein n=1 Tax=Phyllachora maydis TaxID=1825666 RepID=A0AAD9I3H2_9PEZI|nr:hypothetical protein P8C59_004480 [Phyllachora maydis]